jgi:hypothetical protein
MTLGQSSVLVVLKSKENVTVLKVGTMLYGYCGGYFGRDSYEDKRIEAIGADYVVCRDENGNVHFASGENILSKLEEYTENKENQTR